VASPAVARNARCQVYAGSTLFVALYVQSQWSRGDFVDNGFSRLISHC
jgi:hypothetical protein